MASSQNVHDNSETEIDLLEILRVLWSKIWMIVIGFVAGAVLLFLGSKLFVTPQYSAEAIVYIFSKTTSISQMADIQIGSSLTGDFTVIATTREVMESVIAELELDTTYDALRKKVSVTNPQSTHMLKIVVEWPDPVKSAEICNTLSEKLREQISDIMNTDRPSVVQRAIVPQSQSSPNLVRNTVIGALAGALLVCAVLIVLHLLNDTLKSEEDVKKYLDLSTIAVFPYIRSFDSEEKKVPDKRSLRSISGKLRTGRKSSGHEK